MKKLFASVAVVALFATAGSAYAVSPDSFSQGVDVSGFVPTGCTANGAVEDAFELADFVDANFQHQGTPYGAFTVANVTCDTKAKVSIETQNGGLWQSGACGASSSANCIKYEATANWHGQTTPPLITDGTAGASQIASTASDAGNGDLTMTLTTVATNQNVNAGTFSDVITVALTPQN